VGEWRVEKEERRVDNRMAARELKFVRHIPYTSTTIFL